jgi:hypothetical protein
MSDAKSGANNPMYGRTGENNPMYGRTHSDESPRRTLMSDAKTGALNPMFGITPTNAFQSGANHPMYGKVAANAMTVNVYSLDNVLVRSFSSKVAAAIRSG